MVSAGTDLQHFSKSSFANDIKNLELVGKSRGSSRIREYQSLQLRVSASCFVFFLLILFFCCCKQETKKTVTTPEGASKSQKLPFRNLISSACLIKT